MSILLCRALGLLSVVIAVFCAPIRAEIQTVVVPYAEVGLSNYSLEFDGGAINVGGQEVNGSTELFLTFFSLKVGLAATFNNFYLNGYYLATDESSDTQEPYIFGVTPAIKWKGDRTAVSLSGGYSFDNGFSIYGGYRDSETSASGTANSSNEFSHDGYFLGGGYRIGLTDTGGLTVSLGYAWLDVDVDFRPFSFRIPAHGDGSGAKGSVVWRDLFNQHWGYTVAAEYYDYDYELDDDAQVADNFSMRESEARLMIGLFYVL